LCDRKYLTEVGGGVGVVDSTDGMDGMSVVDSSSSMDGMGVVDSSMSHSSMYGRDNMSVVHSSYMTDSSVMDQAVGVQEGVSLSLTLAVHVMKTGVHIGVHRRDTHRVDSRSGDGVVGVVDSSMDSGYSVGHSSDGVHGMSVVDTSNMADSSVVDQTVGVKEGVSLSLGLSLSLTLTVHVVQTGVHMGVHSRSDVVGVVYTSNIVDRMGVVDSSDSVDGMSIIDSSHMADGTVSNSSVARDDTIAVVNSSDDPTVCQTVGDLSDGVGVSLSLSIDSNSGQKDKDEGSHRAACFGDS